MLSEGDAIKGARGISFNLGADHHTERKGPPERPMMVSHAVTNYGNAPYDEHRVRLL